MLRENGFFFFVIGFGIFVVVFLVAALMSSSGGIEHFLSVYTK